MLQKFCLILNVLLLMCGLNSCEEKQSIKRKYREIVVELPEGHASMMQTENSKISTDAQTPPAVGKSQAKIPLTWKAPQEWQEVAGSNFRLVTFFSKGDDAIECSIVSLGGQAGGLEANVRRWMDQIDLKLSTEEEFQQFIQNQEKIPSPGGFSIQVVDFTHLQKEKADGTPSMIAGILTIEDATVFVKMAGSKKAIDGQKENFKELCQSLRLENEKF